MPLTMRRSLPGEVESGGAMLAVSPVKVSEPFDRLIQLRALCKKMCV